MRLLLLHTNEERTLMSYGTVLACLVASVVQGVNEELMQRLAPLWQRIAERVGLFFGGRAHASGDARLRA